MSDVVVVVVLTATSLASVALDAEARAIDDRETTARRRVAVALNACGVFAPSARAHDDDDDDDVDDRALNVIITRTRGDECGANARDRSRAIAIGRDRSIRFDSIRSVACVRRTRRGSCDESVTRHRSSDTSPTTTTTTTTRSRAPIDRMRRTAWSTDRPIAWSTDRVRDRPTDRPTTCVTETRTRGATDRERSRSHRIDRSIAIDRTDVDRIDVVDRPTPWTSRSIDVSTSSVDIDIDIASRREE